MSFKNQPQRPHLYPRTDPHMYSVFNISRGGEASTSDSHSEASSPTEISTMPPTSSVLVVSADEVSSRTLGSSQGGAGDPRTCRRKQGKSYAWLHRDLTLEDEYNIATVEWEDLDDNCSRCQPTATAAPSKASFKPPSRSSDEQGSSQQRLRNAGRTDGDVHYTEYHLHQWFTNFSDIKRRIKHISYVALFEPRAVTVTDVYHTTITEDMSRRPNIKTRCLKRSLSSEVSHDIDERHLPLKKRKRCMTAATTNTAATTGTGGGVPPLAARHDQPSASQADPRAAIPLSSTTASCAEHPAAPPSPSHPSSRRRGTKTLVTWESCLPLKNKTS
ncbi:uncharacterized protein LOC124116483 [Haliotis rufescens]|uniref:uncharacterized protein LOC124116483 n=1 Tax=Haliotis rufescens TaxID=6454 RepID=UPI00201EA173|nr:uncharacterized protein LOC124116483 [Haliotis rufescens]